MNDKKKAKERLIEYLLGNAGTDISREIIIKETGISKSRLSELIKSLKQDGYQITTPGRSGIIRLEKEEELHYDFSAKDVRQWLIILLLSQNEELTYWEIIKKLLSFLDPTVVKKLNTINGKYTDTEIRNVLNKNENLSEELSPHTLRKDLGELQNKGIVDKRRKYYGESNKTVYILTEKAPVVLIKREGALFDFLIEYSTHKNSGNSDDPLFSLFYKLKKIYGWESDETTARVYGRPWIIESKQRISLGKFLEHQYKTNRLFVEYKSGQKNINKTIKTGLIFYSMETSCFYVLCKVMQSKKIEQLRLDKMINIADCNEANDFYKDEIVQNAYDEMFSSTYENKAFEVEVLFQDFGNVMEKVNALQKIRKNASLKRIEKPMNGIPHTYVYEDKIRGLSSFARYLRSFGSSALVIKPLKLRQMMVESANKTLANYGG